MKKTKMTHKTSLILLCFLPLLWACEKTEDESPTPDDEIGMSITNVQRGTLISEDIQYNYDDYSALDDIREEHDLTYPLIEFEIELNKNSFVYLDLSGFDSVPELFSVILINSKGEVSSLPQTSVSGIENSEAIEIALLDGGVYDSDTVADGTISSTITICVFDVSTYVPDNSIWGYIPFIGDDLEEIWDALKKAKARVGDIVGDAFDTLGDFGGDMKDAFDVLLDVVEYEMVYTLAEIFEVDAQWLFAQGDLQQAITADEAREALPYAELMLCNTDNNSTTSMGTYGMSVTPFTSADYEALGFATGDGFSMENDEPGYPTYLQYKDVELAAYTSEEGKILIAFNGTVVDWDEKALTAETLLEDFIAGANDIVPAFTYAAEDILPKFYNTHGDKIVLMGHSLGGGIAHYCGCYYGLDAYCFNSMGLNKESQIESFKQGKYTSCWIRNYNSSECFLTQGIQNRCSPIPLRQFDSRKEVPSNMLNVDYSSGLSGFNDMLESIALHPFDIFDPHEMKNFILAIEDAAK